MDWLNSTIIVNGAPLTHNSVEAKYARCLDAPNYTVFSNNTSAGEWNDTHPDRVTPLESPHDAIHLAVGGYDLPKGPDFSPITGANGDMGENDTAGLDPIFYFHHCFVDRIFWLWQQRAKTTKTLDIIPQYPGTNSVDNQGPTPGVAANSWLTMDSPLDPFRLKTVDGERPYTSRDCIDIEGQLGYTYGPGSTPALPAALTDPTLSTQAVRVAGINRAHIRGSFLVSVFATVNGEKRIVGTEAVLSRWNVSGCANCQTHVETRAFVGLHAFKAAVVPNAIFEVEVRTRDGILKGLKPAPGAAMKRFSFEVL